MPARNIHLTDRYETLVQGLVDSGKFQNASEAVRAGLMLLEKQEEEYDLKMAALRDAVAEGKAAFEQGRYSTFESPEALREFVDSL